MTIREGTNDDRELFVAFLAAYAEELWRRPFRPPAWAEIDLGGTSLLVAEEDGEAVGGAIWRANPEATAHLHLVYVKPERRGRGVGGELLRAFATRAREAGAEHATLGVDTTNTAAIALWRRLGFAEYRLEMSTPVEQLVRRLAGREQAPSFGSVHVQTDDEAAVRRAVEQFVPRLGRSGGTEISPPRNGWIAVYDELCDREPKLLRRLAQELSDRMGGVVLAIGVEEGRVVRFILFDRGRIADEYLSVPEYYGPLPPGDVVALRANPTVAQRLTGADPARVRAAAPIASSPEELPPAGELVAAIGAALGVAGVEHGYQG